MKLIWTLVIAVAVASLVTFAVFAASQTELYPYLCSPEETGPTCVRSWVNPVAALFTVLAIWYASRQLGETRRQSDSSVRVSLVSLRDDLEETLVAVHRIEQRCWKIYIDLMLSHKEEVAGISRSPAKRFSNEEMQRAREFLEDPVDFGAELDRVRLGSRLSPELRLILLDVVEYFSEVESFRHFPVKIVPKFTEDVEETAFKYMPAGEGETIVIHDFGDGFVGLYLQRDGDSLLSNNFITQNWDAYIMLRKFRERVSFEHLVAADALSEIDLRTTAEARGKHERRWKAAEKTGRVPRH